MSKKKHFDLDQPLRHPDHRRPTTRREFIAQGFRAGFATVLGGSVFSLFANPRQAQAALSDDLQDMRNVCGLDGNGESKIPFICFDLAGGANIAGSNVLVGKQGGQLDFLSTAGYVKQGLPGDMAPSVSNTLINTDLGLAFHSDSAMLRGILDKIAAGTAAATNGAVIPARSENDTGNNPHNPMYGINKAGANGELLALIGSSSSESGGNSQAPASMIDPQVRPTKVDRPSDATGLVDVGDLVGLLSQEDTVAVMESMYRISDSKLKRVNTQVTADATIKEMVRCGYLKSADMADRFGNPNILNPEADPDIVGPAGIFTSAEFNNDREFRKTASVMKLVIDGYAGAGTITMGGYDYHTGDRATGEIRDLRAGRCIGACLEYAARKSKPLMIYIFSDGSVSSNGMIDDSPDGRGKGVWTGDNQQTAASFFLVYNPTGRPQLLGGSADEQAIHQQLGYMRASGDVETASSPAANNVNLLVETVVLNYMALHGEQGNFASLFPSHGLGNATLMDAMTAFEPIV
ncbi:general secretion pathway protein GspF [Microbulbifer thermotolerans]|uniref:General secretion pathway protein GspF n=1 Tax=Microbulbifer thermotolerans TaxID=252514 RepID=A0A143HQE7_MICTH|nr:general secretion pathway protein GspF [Microbulbifer thermotolerans]AMX03726.1 general secretion pathway protein GspF [Microbulbifer thermotolerans]MCX2780664.1 general secretion pathway protein GspF [Microbulbifer thermotolerans]MCX2783610.1 general secretion pathway protein GspF [Microbulbifer thermotolerans]MCX2795821.1 general secretion pathway protein GspF [Microbulbifer thermotolerans]MCX2801985.1 general secretion pathway protein GspF [Microbulbifer thermotolerans]